MIIAAHYSPLGLYERHLVLEDVPELVVLAWTALFTLLLGLQGEVHFEGGYNVIG